GVDSAGVEFFRDAEECEHGALRVGRHHHDAFASNAVVAAAAEVGVNIVAAQLFQVELARLVISNLAAVIRAATKLSHRVDRIGCRTTTSTFANLETLFQTRQQHAL